ncbi:unnamed protein product, partial [Discosporangium mesarthrocarpum]
GRFYARRGVCRGHTSYITHLDFTSDSRHIQSNCGAYELLFWDTSGTQIRSASLLRDAVWSTFTCTLGWPVQGVWHEGSDGTRHQPSGVVVTGDDFGGVSLLRYPCVSRQALRKVYTAHSGHVTAVRFTWDLGFVISAGGGDRCVIQWVHQFEDCDTDGDECADGEQGLEDISREGGEARTVLTRTTAADNVAARSRTSGLGLPLHRMTGGDEFLAVKPWAGAIAEPSDFVPRSDLSGCTDVDLELEWVHGYR